MKKITRLCSIVFLFAFLFACDEEKEKDKAVIPVNIIEVTKKTKVIIMGSSIAEGAYLNDSWAKRLAIDTNLVVTNLAKSGYFTRHYLPLSYQNPNHSQKVDTLRNVEKVIKLSPNLVIISLTVNDIANGVTIDEYMGNMEIITSLLKQKSIKVIVTTTVPAAPLPLELRMRLKALAERLKVSFLAVDIHTPLESQTDAYLPNIELYNSDYLHPNSSGHKIIFDLIQKEVKVKRYN